MKIKKTLAAFWLPVQRRQATMSDHHQKKQKVSLSSITKEVKRAFDKGSLSEELA